MDKAKLLVVEDDADIQTSLNTLLTDEGYTVHLAKDGEEAFGYLVDHHDIDLITLDLLMPNVSGYEFLHSLADQEFDPIRHIPIIIVSAMTNAQTIAIQKGHAFVAKPIDAELLIKTIEAQIKKARASRQP